MHTHTHMHTHIHTHMHTCTHTHTQFVIHPRFFWQNNNMTTMKLKKALRHTIKGNFVNFLFSNKNRIFFLFKMKRSKTWFRIYYNLIFELSYLLFVLKYLRISLIYSKSKKILCFTNIVYSYFISQPYRHGVLKPSHEM